MLKPRDDIQFPSPREAARVLGGDLHRDRVRCPGPGHSGGDRSLEVWFRFDAPGGYLVYSFAGDDPLVCRDYVRDRLQLPDWRPTEPLRHPARPPIEPDARQQARTAGALAIWRGSVDPRGTIADAHLRSRGLRLDAGLTSTIRFHDGLRFEGRTVGGIVALMRDIRTNEPCGIHRTFLDGAGRKIGRKMLGRAKGAAIKVDPHECVTLGLHIGEGIETCLTARQARFRPVWALGSAGAIGSFPLLKGIEAVTLLAERDDSGANLRAIQQCAKRHTEAGVEAFVIDPPSGDLNDIARRAA